MKLFNKQLPVVIGLLAVLVQSGLADDKLTPEQTKFFEAKIRPVLARECFGCHSAKVGQTKGGLWLDTKEGMLSGGESGPAIVPGDLDESLLWNAINHLDYQMPPRKKLSAEIIADFRQWIEMGAPDPRIQEVSNIKSSITEKDIEEGKQFWSFKHPEKATIPATGSEWAQSNIDQFVFEKLSAYGLQPSPDADSATVLRRLTFDLIGLPPTPEQLEWLESRWQDDPKSALEHIVDSLLAKPEFGERWGRHWLDVARYAESTGKELNLTYPTAWRYRDFVIDSFNSDKPYNEFVQQQIAGDLMPIKNDKEWSENLVATGFLAVGPKTLTERNPRQFELDLIDEQIDVTTQVMLGVSVSCARCHDHKFDPIPQTDYYALSGIFRSMTTHFGTFQTQQNRRASNLLMLPVDDLSPFDKKISTTELASLKSQLAEKRDESREALRERQQARTSDAKKNQQSSIAKFGRLTTEIGMLESKINSYDDKGKPFTYCMGVQSTDKPINARLMERGEFDKPAQEVERGFPQVLCEQPVKIKSSSTGRLEFARWVGSEQNPLTARVMVNRIWLHLFGEGIVRSPENFGSTGQLPTHPELLDYLAVEFMENGWSVKRLVREIVLSRAYRTGSAFNQASFEIDPENKYLWRVEPKRLDAESLRDSMLAISGELESKRPRASVVAEVGPALVRDGVLVTTMGSNPMSSPGMNMSNKDDAKMSDTNQTDMRREMAARIRERASQRMSGGDSYQPMIQRIDESENYRSVYLPVVRDNLPRALEVFDFAEPSMVVGQRESSNTPDQGLYFLNNEFVIQQSNAMARRLIKENDKVKTQLEAAYLLAYGRPGTSDELRLAASFYRNFTPDQSSRRDDLELQKLSAVCQAIMASAEFRFLN